MSDYIPEEILIEILLKLPVKSLIRSTSICKEWGCLIRSPSISNHLSNSENQGFLKYHDINYKERGDHYRVIPKRGPFVINSDSNIEFPFKLRCGFFRIVGSSDGLVCLSQNFNLRIIIWNPAIRNHVVLPHPLVNLNKYDRVVLGFGVSRNVYKVVRLVCCEKHLEAEIFCLGGTESEGWRKLTGFDVRVCCLIKYLNLCGPIFFKGFVHWPTHEPMRDCYSILRFHVGDEVFSETMLPDDLERNDILYLSLAIMGESLGFIKYDRKIGNHRCDVWMMKDYGMKESWTKLYTIDAVCLNRVIGFWGSGEALVSVRGQELATYNPQTKGIRHVGVCEYSLMTFYVDDYKESLVLLGGGYSEDPGSESWKACGGMKTTG